MGLRPQWACVCGRSGMERLLHVLALAFCSGQLSPAVALTTCQGVEVIQRNSSDWVLCVIFSLQGLLSAADDLLKKLLESEDMSLLGIYIASVMPDHREWEKMRRLLPKQVCLRPESISHSEVWILCERRCNISGEEKQVNENRALFALMPLNALYRVWCPWVCRNVHVGGSSSRNQSLGF